MFRTRFDTVGLGDDYCSEPAFRTRQPSATPLIDNYIPRFYPSDVRQESDASRSFRFLIRPAATLFPGVRRISVLMMVLFFK